MDKEYAFYIETDGRVTLPHLAKQVTGADAMLEGQARLNGWVASEFFSFFSSRLPVQGRAKILNAIPYALEEFLIEDADNYHFTPILSTSKTSGSVDAHVIAHSKMRAWLDLLKNIQITPLGIYPDIYALPYKEGVITAFVSKGRCLARTRYGGGFCGRGDFFTQMLIKQARDEGKKIEIISDEKKKLPSSLRAYPLTYVGSFTEFLGQARLPSSDFNAMHGEYAAGVRMRKTGNFSRRTLKWIASLFVVILLAQQSLSIFADRERLRMQQALNVELFRQMFDIPLTDPSQLQSRTLAALEALDQGTISEIDPVWERVNIVSSVLNACSDCIVTSFKTAERNRRVDIKLVVKNQKVLNKKMFENLGWRILRWRDKGKEALSDGRPPLHILDIIASERK